MYKRQATTGLTQTFRAGNHAEVVRQALIDEVGLDVRVEGVAAADHAPAPSAPEPPDLPSRAAAAAPSPVQAVTPAAPPPVDAPAAPPEQAPQPAAPPPSPRAPEARVASPSPSGSSLSAPRPEAPAAATHLPPGEAHAHADSVRHELARAKEATRRSLEAKHSGATRHTAPRPPEDEVSLDDEDLDVSTDMGQAVIERLLGGQVLEEFDE